MPTLLHCAGVSRYFCSIVTSQTKLSNQRKCPAFSNNPFFLKDLFLLATDGSSVENEEFIPTLIRHFALDGLITASLLDMPDIDKGSSAQIVFDTCTVALP